MKTGHYTQPGSVAVALAWAVSIAACSPGTLPGSPSRIEFGGGGGRYNGTISYQRTGGDFLINEAQQSMSLSLVLAAADQFTAQFQTSGGSAGSLQGLLSGALNNGTFEATLLVTQPADSPGASAGLLTQAIVRPRAVVTCDGRGQATGSFSGPDVAWVVGAVNYSNCRLVTSSQARATATSPIPQINTARATVVITILPGATVRPGTCENGARGYQFTIEVAETSGVAVTLDETITVEERRGGQAVSVRREDNPLTRLGAGERRRYSACSPSSGLSGTYQAFFTGHDAHGNALRFSSPLVTLLP